MAATWANGMPADVTESRTVPDSVSGTTFWKSVARYVPVVYVSVSIKTKAGNASKPICTTYGPSIPDWRIVTPEKYTGTVCGPGVVSGPKLNSEAMSVVIRGSQRSAKRRYVPGSTTERETSTRRTLNSPSGGMSRSSPASAWGGAKVTGIGSNSATGYVPVV